jgi:zinc protease
MMLMHVTAKEDVDVERLERALDDEIARLVEGGVTSDELTRARNRAEVEYAHQIENYDTRADLIAMLSTYFSEPQRVHSWLEPYNGATTDDLAHVAQKYLVPENRVTSVFVPERSAA